MEKMDWHIEETSRRLERAWAKWGEVDAHVLSFEFPSVLSKAPRWPAGRNVYRLVRRNGTLLIASDGLSDPFDPSLVDVPEEEIPQINGFRLEVFGTSPEPEGPVEICLLLDVIGQVADLCAHAGNLSAGVHQLGSLSSQVTVAPQWRRPSAGSADYLVPGGTFGVLLGAPIEPIDRYVEGTLSPIILVSVTLLLRKEIELLASCDHETRADFVEALVAAGEAGRCGFTRRSVL